MGSMTVCGCLFRFFLSGVDRDNLEEEGCDWRAYLDGLVVTSGLFRDIIWVSITLDAVGEHCEMCLFGDGCDGRERGGGEVATF